MIKFTNRFVNQFKSTVIKSNQGFSLIELMIAAAILVALSYAGISMMQNLYKGTRSAKQNSDRLEYLDTVRFLLQNQDQCDRNFAGKDPTTVTTYTKIIRRVGMPATDQTLIETTTGVNYAGDSIHFSNITLGGAAPDFVLLASADNLNGVANLKITVDRVGTGGQYGGAQRTFDIPIAVRLVPVGASVGVPGTIDHCRYGTGSISITNFFNIDDTFPAAIPLVGTNQSTAYSTNYNIAIGQPQNELYNIRFRTEGGDMLAKDGNLYISRDGSTCVVKQCTNKLASTDPTCALDTDCSGGASCVFSDKKCPAVRPLGDGLLNGGPNGDIVVGFGEYTRMINTFGPGTSANMRADQMFLIGWDSPSGNIGVAMPENSMFKTYGIKSGATTTITRASLSATGNVYTNHIGAVGAGAAPISGENTRAGETALIGVGHWETMLTDADYYGINRKHVFGIGWSDGGAAGSAVARAGFMIPEGWGFMHHMQDSDGNGRLKPGYSLFFGNSRIQGDLTLKKTLASPGVGIANVECGIAGNTYANDVGGAASGEPNIHCGNGDLRVDGNVYVGGSMLSATAGPVNISGDVTISGNFLAGGTITSSSDERLKKEIKPLENSLEKLLNIRGVSYKWKDPSKEKDQQIGLIAQNVQKTYPELVRTDKNGMLSVAYQNFVAPIIESIREIYSKVVFLMTAVDKLQKDVEELKSENLQLKEALCEHSPSLKICLGNKEKKTDF